MDTPRQLRLASRSRRMEDSLWKWSVWVEGPPDQLGRIESVEYVLHPTFQDPIRQVHNSSTNFRLDSEGRGDFVIYANVQMKNGECVSLEHSLSLDRSPRRTAAPLKETLAGGAGRPTASPYLESTVRNQSVTTTRSEKIRRLTESIRNMETETDVESLARSRPPAAEAAGFEGAYFETLDSQASPESGLDKVLSGREDELTDEELFGLEAIVMPQGRPVVFIRDGAFDDLGDPWTHVNKNSVRSKVQPTFPAIGRVELPNSLRIPYGGTGFVVGPGLLMTNRHVAELFANGLGSRGLVYRAGDAAVNFRRHHGDDEDDRTAYLEVEKVLMIHPYWDMALLSVGGLAGVKPLTLAVESPDDLVGREVAAVGYPARDERSDLTVQDRIFQRVYGVKRFQPGKIRPRDAIRSFETKVKAMTHDSSTLGGNSGSAIVDLTTGRVIGLHFAGVYLKANYAVPAYELARDPRVVAAGVNFAGTVKPTRDFDTAWKRAEAGKTAQVPVPDSVADDADDDDASAVDDDAVDGGNVSNAADGDPPSLPTVSPNGTLTWTVPIRISVSLGGLSPVPNVTTGPAAPATEAMRPPVIHGRLEDREGYSADFLDGEEVPMPELTAAGRKLVAKLDDGDYELRYHHFSVVMHKLRRLALFTAANVDWRDSSRKVKGRKPGRRELAGLGPNDMERWVTDPRIPDAHQLPDVFFTKDRRAFDKGHLVRRDDVAWGRSFKDMQKANGDTFHTTNCSPQVGAFNRSSEGVDNWGDLENLVQQQTKAEKVCVFSGPVFTEKDPVFHGRDLRGETEVQIPRAYWKVVVALDADGPAAYGFMLKQDLSDVAFESAEEMAVPKAWKRYMASVADIEATLGGLAKLTWLKKHDRFETAGGEAVAEAVRR